MKPFRMHGTMLLFFGAIIIGMMWNDAWGEEAKAAPPKRPEFDAFRILIDRNAFDATRSSKAKREAQENADAPPPPAQTLRLLGTWIDSENASALFEGDGASPREGVKRGGTIAGYNVEDIRTDAVVLRKDQATIELRVGAGLEKGKDETWSVVEVVPERKPEPEPAKGGWAPKISDDDNSKADAAAKPDKDSSGDSRKRSRRKENAP